MEKRLVCTILVRARHLYTSLSRHSDSNGFSPHPVLTCLLLSKRSTFDRTAGPQTAQALSIVDALRANSIILLVFASLAHRQPSNSNQRRNGYPTLRTCYIWGIKRSQRLPRYIQDPEMTPIRTPPPGAAQPPNPPDPAKSIDQTSQSLPIPFSRVPASAQVLQLQPFLL
jgi:hypothetical protein